MIRIAQLTSEMYRRCHKIFPKLDGVNLTAALMLLILDYIFFKRESAIEATPVYDLISTTVDVSIQKWIIIPFAIIVLLPDLSKLIAYLIHQDDRKFVALVIADFVRIIAGSYIVFLSLSSGLAAYNSGLPGLSLLLFPIGLLIVFHSIGKVYGPVR